MSGPNSDTRLSRKRSKEKSEEEFKVGTVALSGTSHGGGSAETDFANSGSHELIVDLYYWIMGDQPENPNLSLGGGTP